MIAELLVAAIVAVELLIPAVAVFYLGRLWERRAVRRDIEAGAREWLESHSEQRARGLELVEPDERRLG